LVDFADILAREPDWPDALVAQFWFLITQGDHAFNHATLDEAFGHFQAAETTVQRLLKAEPDAPRSQSDLSVSYERIGNVQSAQGDLTSALSSYKQGLEIRQKLAARDPANAQWKTDLVISLCKLGSILEQQDTPQKREAGVDYERALELFALAGVIPLGTGCCRCVQGIAILRGEGGAWEVRCP
jgi:tetratricopeptide (TPR) repeat protein